MSEPNETRCKIDKEKDIDETEDRVIWLEAIPVSSSIPADVNNVLPTARVGSGGGENNGSEIYKHTKFWKMFV